MNDLRKAAEMAATDLEELISWHGIRDSNNKLMPAHNQTPEIKSAMESLEALRQALAQPKQEPVAWHEPGVFGNVTTYKKWALENGWKPLYTAPPKREWVGLTGEEISVIDWKSNETLHDYARTIEAKLKEKNA